MINEALVEEVRREEQKRRRSDRTAAAGTEAQTSAAASGSRESPIEPDPKRRLIMKSASTTVSGSRQEIKKSNPDVDSRMQIEEKAGGRQRGENRTTQRTVDKHPKKNCSEVRTESGHHTRSS